MVSTSKHFDFSNGSVNFTITDEGLIVDVFDQNGEPVATEAKTATEWADWALHNERVRARLRAHDAVFGHGD